MEQGCNSNAKQLNAHLNSGEFKLWDKEILDIIDEDNNVLRQTSRDEAFKHGFLHRGIHLFIFNSKDELFIQKRSKTKTACPDCWDLSMAEHADAGESFEQATICSLKEELGIDLPLDKLEKLRQITLAYLHEEFIDNELNTLFKTSYDGEIKIDEKEVVEGKFISLDELQKLRLEYSIKLSSWFALQLDWYLNKFGK